jgi:hypothetical protein
MPLQISCQPNNMKQKLELRCLQFDNLWCNNIISLVSTCCPLSFTYMLVLLTIPAKKCINCIVNPWCILFCKCMPLQISCQPNNMKQKQELRCLQFDNLWCNSISLVSTWWHVSSALQCMLLILLLPTTTNYKKKQELCCLLCENKNL